MGKNKRRRVLLWGGVEQMKKLQAPNPKLQRSSKFQVPELDEETLTISYWCLEFEVSLELGAWDLELRPQSTNGHYL
jgi:hypothetical protein